MMIRLLAGLSLVLLLGATPQAFGNGGVPPFPFQPRPLVNAGEQKVKFAIEIDNKAKQPRLEVPSNLVLNNALMPGALPGAPLVPPAPPPGRRFGALSIPTVVAGLALALAFTSGGLWLARRGKGRNLTLGALVLIGLAVGGVAWADIAVPRPRPAPPAPKRDRVELPANVTLPANITFQIVAPGNEIKLVVSQAMLVPAPKAGAAPSKAE